MGQIRVIFRIPERFSIQIFGPNAQLPGPLVYVEWFSRSQTKGRGHGMYPVSRSMRANGQCDASIIELNRLIRPCHLFPKFSGNVDRAWKSSNVLERSKHFFVNNFLDHHTYQTTW